MALFRSTSSGCLGGSILFFFVESIDVNPVFSRFPLLFLNARISLPRYPYCSSGQTRGAFLVTLCTISVQENPFLASSARPLPSFLILRRRPSSLLRLSGLVSSFVLYPTITFLRAPDSLPLPPDTAFRLHEDDGPVPPFTETRFFFYPSSISRFPLGAYSRRRLRLPSCDNLLSHESTRRHREYRPPSRKGFEDVEDQESPG